MFKSDTTEINKGTNSTYALVSYNWNKQGTNSTYVLVSYNGNKQESTYI